MEVASASCCPTAPLRSRRSLPACDQAHVQPVEHACADIGTSWQLSGVHHINLHVLVQELRVAWQSIAQLYAVQACGAMMS